MKRKQSILLERGVRFNMRSNIKLFTILVAFLVFLGGCGASGSSNTNDTAKEERDNEEHRIIATTVAIVEMMEELDLDLVGIPTTYKELSPRYQELQEVGIANEPDMEIIKSLQPTDVLSVTTLQDDVEEYYEQTNTPITFLDLESVDGLYASIEQLGETYNRQAEAEQIVQRFVDKMEETEAKIAGKEKPNVLILLGVPGSFLVATENSYLGDLVERAGGVNVFPGEDGVEYTSANTEHLQQTNPDVILRAAHGMPDEVVKMFDKEFKENDVWKHFKAVKNNRVYDLEETLFGTTANLAADQALEDLVNMLYPDEE